MPYVFTPDSLVWNKAQAAAFLTQQITAAATAGFLSGALKVDLWTAAITPTPNNVLADLVVATYTGYVQKSIAGWGAVRTDASGNVSADGSTILEWTGPAAGGGPVIQGYSVSNIAGTTLLYSVKFSQGPVSLIDATQVLNVIPTFKFPPTA